jgi:DNA-binding NtrC family response regulator
MSGHGTVDTAVGATRLGAVDFVEKPLSLAKLLRTVETALKHKLPSPAIASQRALTAAAPLGKSQAMRALRERATAIAAGVGPVLITGEYGSGREVLARYIHQNSDVSGQPFVKLVSSTLTAENLSEQLLGSTGPGGEGFEPGCLERARGGTLYIADSQELPETAQSVLRGIIEQGEFSRLGSAERLPLDTRVVCSVQPGARGLDPGFLALIAGVELGVPPLRDYPDDITELLRHFVDRLVDEEGLTFRRFSVSAQNRLRHYPWPGNVGELERLVRRLLRAGGDEDISLAEVDAELPTEQRQAEPLIKQDLIGMPLREAREHFERAYLLEQLRLCDGKVGRLAKRVGMERTHLYRKLRSLGIDFRQVGEDR